MYAIRSYYAASKEAPAALAGLAIPIVRNAALTLAKASSTTEVTSAGQVVPYTYQLNNAGNVTLTGLTLADNHTDAVPVCPAATLAPAEAMTCTAQYTVITSYSIHYTKLYDDTAETEPVQDTLAIPIVRNAKLAIDETSTTTSLSAPGTVTYDYLVTNTGNVVITSYSIHYTKLYDAGVDAGRPRGPLA